MTLLRKLSGNNLNYKEEEEGGLYLYFVCVVKAIMSQEGFFLYRNHYNSPSGLDKTNPIVFYEKKKFFKATNGG